jgi:hypothetical protein
MTLMLRLRSGSFIRIKATVGRIKVPRPNSGGTGTFYTRKRARAVSIRRRRRAAGAKNIVMMRRYRLGRRHGQDDPPRPVATQKGRRKPAAFLSVSIAPVQIDGFHGTGTSR